MSDRNPRLPTSSPCMVRRKSALPLALATAAIMLTLCAAESRAQNLVGNHSFETPDAGGGFVNRSGPNAMNPWSVNGNVDHIGGFWAAAAGAQSVDMNGSGPATVYQSLATQPGRLYLVRFALSENFYGYADKTMDVLWGGDVVQSVVIVHDPARTPTDMRWYYRELTVPAASTLTQLAFRSTTGSMNGSLGNVPWYGPAIDDVSVTALACDPCDANCDGSVNQFDIIPFVNALSTNPPAPCSPCAADANNDGSINQFDIPPFVQCLSG